MDALYYIVAAVCLPLFPASMVFNRVFARCGSLGLRMIILVAWPVAGLAAVHMLGAPVPDWALAWAALTALLYAFRTLTVRDLRLWTAHMATSTWALLWLVGTYVEDPATLVLLALALSAPYVLLAWIAGRIEAAHGAAYAGPVSGLAQTQPRLAALLVLTLLAVVGTPLFPAFFALLATVTHVMKEQPLASLFTLIAWLLWAWSGARLTRAMVVGSGHPDPKPDLRSGTFRSAAGFVLVLAVAGLLSSGYLL